MMSETVTVSNNAITLGDYTIEAIHSFEELLALKEAWDRLHQACAATPSLFLTWDWITTWWQVYQEDKQLWVLLAKRASNGELVGIAPLALMQDRNTAGSWRMLSFLGTWDSYHLDFIIRPGEEVAVTSAFVSYLRGRRNEWDFLDLVSLDANSPSLGGLFMEGTWFAREPLGYLYVDLSGGWEAYRQQRSSRSHRILGQTERRLQRDHPDQKVSFDVYRDVAEAEPVFDAMTCYMHRRWGNEGESLDAYRKRAQLRFVRAAVEMCSRLGYTRLGSLRVGDHIIATNLVFVYNGVVYGFRMAFDRDWGRYGPGVLLLNFMIRNLTEEGVHHFEMGDGVTEHKARWSTGLRMDMHLRTSGRVGPQLMMQSIQAGQGLWKVVKRALPSSARDSIRRALGYGLPGIVDEQAEALEES